ncbi:MAG: hypothetical protein Aureis2KO_02920 [Aureisphaera sp.]
MQRFKTSLFALALLITIGATFVNCNMEVNDIGFLDDSLNKIEANILYQDSINIDVSKVPVAWHLDHTLKTINGIYDAMEASNPDDFNSSFNMPRVMSLTLNYIPRGRAQSPTAVLPPEIIEKEALYRQLKEARENVKMAFQLDEHAHFEHPVFGIIARGNSLRFLEVHTEHHLKIIRDILKE